MEYHKTPAPWPQSGSLVRHLARYLTAQAPRFNGLVPIQPFWDNHPHLFRSQISALLTNLRKKFGYYCRWSARPNFVECAMEWPHRIKVPEYTEDGGFLLEEELVSDPRINSPQIKWKFKRPGRGTRLSRVAVFAIRRRDKRTRICDFKPLFKDMHGSKIVLNRFTVLNLDCGFRITKVNKDTYDGLYYVERERNRKINTPNDI